MLIGILLLTCHPVPALWTPSKLKTHHAIDSTEIQSNPNRSEASRPTIPAPLRFIFTFRRAGVGLTHTIVTGRSVENMNTT